MKYFILLLVALVAFLGCKKDNADAYYWGHCYAKLNGEEWEGRTRTIINKPYEQGFDMKINRLTQHDFILDGLYFFKVPWSVGKHKLTMTDVRIIDSLSGVSFYTLIDGDILGDSYELAEGDLENYIEVTEIKENKIWVKFQMTLAVKRYGSEPKYPDTIRVTEGRANGKLEE